MRKNRLYLLLMLIIAISAISCNRTFDCECSSAGKVLTVTPIHTLGKYGAKQVCNSYQEQNNRNGGRQVCKIK